LRNQQLTHIVALSSALRSSTDLFGVGQQIAVAIQTMTGSARVVVAVVEQEQQISTQLRKLASIPVS
jgi:hypothetical protein